MVEKESEGFELNLGLYKYFRSTSMIDYTANTGKVVSFNEKNSAYMVGWDRDNKKVFFLGDSSFQKKILPKYDM